MARQEAADRIRRLSARWAAPSDQQGAYVVVLQHLTGPPGGGQCIEAHPVGQPMGAASLVAALAAFFLGAFFFWAFFGASLAGCAACTELVAAGALAAGASAVSAAQAGTAKIKAINNSNIFFMVHSL